MTFFSVCSILGFLSVVVMARMVKRSAKFALKCSEDALETQRKLVAALVDHRETLDKLAQANRELMLERAKNIAVSSVGRAGGSPAPDFALDAQTISLIRLAVSNPNDNERKSAALIVCERLKAQIDRGSA